MIFAALIVSAIPLNLAVKMLGGDSSILKVILANIAVGLIAIFIAMQFGIYAGIIPFLIMLFVYKYMFEIGLFKAFIAWILQFVIIIVIIFVLIVFLGLTLI